MDWWTYGEMKFAQLGVRGWRAVPAYTVAEDDFRALSLLVRFSWTGSLCRGLSCT